ncbi:lipopolysaccharide biosynthesis protein [Shewanella colwelliana]|uniref:lipopolysaccharide biosynthesis protein n=1 Tax=Shewanella colwelliana TaxID=23 RepID=UPI003735E3BC
MSSLRTNVSHGVLWQGLSITSSFLLVPISISYLGKDNYGVWIVLYSFLLMLTSCDLGVSSSFRNLLTKSITQSNEVESIRIVSTTYAIIALLSLAILIMLVFFTTTFDFEVFKYFPIGVIIFILVVSLLDYNLKLILTIYTAHQKAFLLPMITALINLSFLFATSTINYFNIGEQGYRLYIFCAILPVCSFLANLFVTFKAFLGEMKNIRPRLTYVDKSFFKPLLISGSGFFIIQISMAILTQYSSILIFEYSSSEILADISILDRFFGLISVVGAVILFPFWSKFTSKHVEGDYVWIENCIMKLECLFALAVLVVILMLLVFPVFLTYWLVDQNASISFSLSFIVALKYLAILLNSIYSYFLNGIGKIKLQMILFITGSVFLLPASGFLYELYGAQGIVGYSTAVYFVMALSQKIYSRRLIKERLYV